MIIQNMFCNFSKKIFRLLLQLLLFIHIIIFQSCNDNLNASKNIENIHKIGMNEKYNFLFNKFVNNEEITVTVGVDQNCQKQLPGFYILKIERQYKSNSASVSRKIQVDSEFIKNESKSYCEIDIVNGVIKVFVNNLVVERIVVEKNGFKSFGSEPKGKE